jgi:hypothetical protein
MTEFKIDDETYTERQYKKDLIRLLDSCKKEDDTTRGTTDCDSIICIDCPLHEKACMCNGPSSELKIPWLERVKTVYDWAKKHPVFTNKDMLKKTFGKDVIHYIEARPYKEKWLEQEYKEPTKEEKD